MGNLIAADINIAAGNGSRAISTKGNLSAGGYILAVNLSRLLVADGCDICQIFCQLDFQLVAITIDTDVLVSQFRAVCTTDDIKSVVQLLGNFCSILWDLRRV